MPLKWDPIVLSTEMNQYGYWVVIISTRPGGRVASTVALVGITAAEAAEAALTTVSKITSTEG